VSVQMTFVGTATTLLRLGPFTLLTDPNFLHAGERAYLGYGMSSRRRTEPALNPGDLPPLDAVLLSHLHGDHFDRIAQRELPRDLPIVTTEQAQRRLARRGFSGAVALAPWDEYDMWRDDHRLRVTAVPGRPGPPLVHHLMPDVMGSVVDLEHSGLRIFRLYITGDTLFRPVLAEVSRRMPGIDAMLLHLGGTRMAGATVTMNAEQGVRLMRTVEPGVTIPIHYDDYSVFREPLSRFLDQVRSEGMADKVRVVVRGETLALTPERIPTAPGLRSRT
jgi:L-ascorbate metabolism protein UlaG (beta-lactamase superfamily)